MPAPSTHETKMVNVRLDPEVWQLAKAQADTEGMYLNRWLERAIKQEIARQAKLAASNGGND